MKQRFILFLFVGMLFCPSYLRAELEFYTDRSAWESDLNSVITTESFNSVTPFFLTDGINVTGQISIGMINHSQVNERNSIEDELFVDFTIDESPFFRGSFTREDADAVTNLILPSPVYAFGGDFTTTHNVDGLALEVNGAYYLFEDLLPEGDGDGFLGFIATNSFSMVTLFDPVQDNSPVFRLGESFGLDNVSFAVPEPAALGLFILGVLNLQRFTGSIRLVPRSRRK